MIQVISVKMSRRPRRQGHHQPLRQKEKKNYQQQHTYVAQMTYTFTTYERKKKKKKKQQHTYVAQSHRHFLTRQDCVPWVADVWQCLVKSSAANLSSIFIIIRAPSSQTHHYCKVFGSYHYVLASLGTPDRCATLTLPPSMPFIHQDSSGVSQRHRLWVPWRLCPGSRVFSTGKWTGKLEGEWEGRTTVVLVIGCCFLCVRLMCTQKHIRYLHYSVWDNLALPLLTAPGHLLQLPGQKDGLLHRRAQGYLWECEDRDASRRWEERWNSTCWK